MPTPLKLKLFTGFGVELEYMIVKEDTLDVLPITDQVMRAISGEFCCEVNLGEIAWSNELVLHVIELKTANPVHTIEGLEPVFQLHVRKINEILESFHATLLPTAMHPWMNPDKEMRLWPHGQDAIYESFNQIFDCRGHGWANLQSAHLNLPFSNDEEFAKLHAAIRVLLPLLPAVAASSPFVEGRKSSSLDHRLEVYKTNCIKIPSITALVIPEPIVSREQYEREILQKMYRDIAPYDKDKVLQEEWLNARGAIARFERYTIEIRVLDVQECPLADLAIIRWVVLTLQALTEGRFGSVEEMNEISTEALSSIFNDIVVKADEAIINDKHYLKLFGLKRAVSAKELATMIAEEVWFQKYPTSDEESAFKLILEQGCLAKRMVKAYERAPNPKRLHAIYHDLVDCLEEGRQFTNL